MGLERTAPRSSVACSTYRLSQPGALASCFRRTVLSAVLRTDRRAHGGRCLVPGRKQRGWRVVGSWMCFDGRGQRGFPPTARGCERGATAEHRYLGLSGRRAGRLGGRGFSGGRAELEKTWPRHPSGTAAGNPAGGHCGRRWHLEGV